MTKLPTKDRSTSPLANDFVKELGETPHDLRNPDPSWALNIDTSLPMDAQCRAALALDARSFSRKVILPLARPLARTALVLVGIVRVIFPNVLTSSSLLHHLIYWGLRHFVSPQANFLILRHFHLGSNVVRFLADNSGEDVPTHPLRPLQLRDIKADLFLQHDLNLYNFMIRLNTALRGAGRSLQPPAKINFAAISSEPIDFAPFPRGLFNIIDATTAIELYTPLYYLLLGGRDFARAYHSLQLDETIAIYAAQILGDSSHLALVNNRHPHVPLSAMRSGFRLVLHGLGTEVLHAVLVHHKRTAEAPAAEGTVPQGHGFGLAGYWLSKRDLP